MKRGKKGRERRRDNIPDKVNRDKLHRQLTKKLHERGKIKDTRL